jgi:hypothetical protein
MGEPAGTGKPAGPERFVELMPFSLHTGVRLLSATKDEVIRLTRRLAFVETELRDHDGRLVAAVSQIQTYTYPRE